MATAKGLESAIEFTKHVMTLSGAGIAFIAALDLSGLSEYQKISFTISLVCLAFSLAAGLLVWSRATVMSSNRRYSLNDPYLRYPGIANLIAFGLGVVALGTFVFIKLLP